MGASEYIQLYVYSCTRLGYPEYALVGRFHFEGVFQILFFFAQMIELARYYLILSALKNERNLARKAWAIKTLIILIAGGCVCVFFIS